MRGKVTALRFAAALRAGAALGFAVLLGCSPTKTESVAPLGVGAGGAGAEGGSSGSDPVLKGSSGSGAAASGMDGGSGGAPSGSLGGSGSEPSGPTSTSDAGVDGGYVGARDAGLDAAP